MRNGFLLAVSLLLALAAMAIGAAIKAEEEGPHHEDRPPSITRYMARPAVLVFSKTAAWRHNEGIAGADRFFAELAQEKGLGFFTTQNSAVFNDQQLSLFDVVVFNNVTGDALSPDQEMAFRNWLKDGKGWIGIHGSGDDSHSDWPWYAREMIGPEFIGHPANPQFQTAELVSLSLRHPVMRGMPERWAQIDEWYSFEGLEYLAGAVPLVGLDESTYTPQNLVYGDHQDLRMGKTPENHPIVWTRCMDGARAFYSAIGHGFEAYDYPQNRRLLTNAFGWVRNESQSDEGCATTAGK